MSIIHFRIYEKTEPLEKYTLIDLFPVHNIQFRIRSNESKLHWYEDLKLKTEIEQSFIKPIRRNEILAEYLSDPLKSDGYIIYLNDFVQKRSYKKANIWLNNLYDSHTELIRELGWDVELFLGYNPQKWISKKFERHARRLNLKIITL